MTTESPALKGRHFPARFAQQEPIAEQFRKERHFDLIKRLRHRL